MGKSNIFTVEHEDREMKVIIPDTGDESENQYLEEAEREKTLDQLKKKPTKEQSKLSKEDKVIAIKEVVDYKKRKSVNPKYISVGSYTS